MKINLANYFKNTPLSVIDDMHHSLDMVFLVYGAL